MLYPTKIALILQDDLLAWQKVNVAAFLAGGLVGTHSQLVGEPYLDREGRRYTCLLREPVFVYQANADEMQRTYQRAISRDIRLAIYTRQLFTTNNDVDNRAAVRTCRSDELDLVGLALHADRKIVDKITDKLKFMS